MSLKYAVLGILSIRPMSGYDVKKVIDESVGHFWTADQSQVYRTLGALVEDGLASRRTVIQDERPNMHLHAVTDDGLAALDQWLASPLRNPPTREPFLARLFVADRMPIAEIRRLLDARRGAVSDQLAAMESIDAPESGTDLGQVLRLSTLANGIAHAKAELAWLDATERQLERTTS